jgi:hypothetical protein
MPWVFLPIPPHGKVRLVCFCSSSSRTDPNKLLLHDNPRNIPTSHCSSNNQWQASYIIKYITKPRSLIDCKNFFCLSQVWSIKTPYSSSNSCNNVSSPSIASSHTCAGLWGHPIISTSSRDSDNDQVWRLIYSPFVEAVYQIAVKVQDILASKCLYEAHVFSRMEDSPRRGVQLHSLLGRMYVTKVRPSCTAGWMPHPANVSVKADESITGTASDSTSTNEMGISTIV